MISKSNWFCIATPPDWPQENCTIFCYPLKSKTKTNNFELTLEKTPIKSLPSVILYIKWHINYECLTLSGSKFTLNPMKLRPSKLSLDKCGISVWQNALARSPVSLLRSRDALCWPSPKKNTSVHCILNMFLRVKSQPLWTFTLGNVSSCRPSTGLNKLGTFQNKNNKL